MTSARLRWAAALVLTVLPLTVLVAWLGTEPLLDALTSVGPLGLAAAAVVGAAVTALQAERWRRVSTALGADLGARSAFSRMYAGGFLNSVLPGGVGGDVLRAVDQGAGSGWKVGAQAVAGERLVGAAVVLLGAGTAFIWVHLPVAAALLTGALVALGLARAALRQVPWPVLLSALALSVAYWVLLLGLALVASHEMGMALSGEVVILATLALAGTGIPGSIGGWGPREAVTIAGAMALGLGAAAGFTLAAAYGLLATVSTLPGALALLAQTGRLPGLRRGGG